MENKFVSKLSVFFIILLMVLPTSYAEEWGYGLAGILLLTFLIILLLLAFISAILVYVIINKFGTYKMKFKEIFVIYVFLTFIAFIVLRVGFKDLAIGYIDFFWQIKIPSIVLFQNLSFVAVYFFLKYRNNKKNNITQ